MPSNSSPSPRDRTASGVSPRGGKSDLQANLITRASTSILRKKGTEWISVESLRAQVSLELADGGGKVIDLSEALLLSGSGSCEGKEGNNSYNNSYNSNSDNSEKESIELSFLRFLKELNSKKRKYEFRGDDMDDPSKVEIRNINLLSTATNTNNSIINTTFPVLSKAKPARDVAKSMQWERERNEREREHAAIAAAAAHHQAAQHAAAVSLGLAHSPYPRHLGPPPGVGMCLGGPPQHPSVPVSPHPTSFYDHYYYQQYAAMAAAQAQQQAVAQAHYSGLYAAHPQQQHHRGSNSIGLTRVIVERGEMDSNTILRSNSGTTGHNHYGSNTTNKGNNNNTTGGNGNGNGSGITGFNNNNNSNGMNRNSRTVSPAFSKWYNSRPQEIQQAFFEKFGLDQKAIQRFRELSDQKQMVAIQRFSPNPSTPPIDYPKVFMSYLKNFFQEGTAEEACSGEPGSGAIFSSTNGSGSGVE